MLALLFFATFVTLLFLALCVPAWLHKHGQTVKQPRKPRRNPQYDPAMGNDELYDFLHEQALEDAQMWD